MRIRGALVLFLSCAAPALAVAPMAGGEEPPKSEATPTEKPAATKLLTGWNGDHFFVQSADDRFVLQPYGYVQGDYRIYSGDGVPANTFALRRARLGVQGKLEKYYEFAFLIDAADTSSTLLRDAYVNVNYVREAQLTVGQFTEPFGQEAATVGVTNIDFVERGLTSLLYPSAAGSFRSPGAMLHGDIAKGVVSYWFGAFNGKGPLAANTTSEPEIIGRLRIYPFKGGDNDWLKGFAIGGAIGHGRSRGLSNELSFGSTVGDRVFTLVPQIPINGPVDRYNGELTFAAGPLALRGEYDELHQLRRSLDVGFADLPQMLARAFNISATYLLTGERRPENGQPKPATPFLGPEGLSGIGAWEAKARYSYLWAQALGDVANGFPDVKNSVYEISLGLNWYPSALVRYTLDFNIYKVKDAATAGGQPPQTFLVVLQRVQFKF